MRSYRSGWNFQLERAIKIEKSRRRSMLLVDKESEERKEKCGSYAESEADSFISLVDMSHLAKNSVWVIFQDWSTWT